ncbi:MAG: hypothetical protein AVDCRST_MAG66-1642 [uncultured Pseudonocardia sp.]|uniref:Tryptophan-rich sensory protein n=1 Tax=uncultured Pseudonocardia sp. TaxID=211455 RepID=A0A6J4P317_9PSEU|nr:MAG: hypothetical protein AVDCRST_MAG66-1642 [uncultured Pseudonocardia sp.]
MSRATPRAGLLLALALLQIGFQFVPAVQDNSFTRADRLGEPPIVPAGYAFAIWGLIQALSLAWAVRSLVRPSPLTERLAGPLSVTFAGFTLWLVAVTYVDPVWLTLAIFLVMLAGLLVAMRTALGAQEEIARWDAPSRNLLWGLLGFYTGWASIANWVNLTTAVSGSGGPITGTVGVVAQLAVLAGAAATALVILRWTGGLLPYAATAVWAFVAVVIGATGAGEPLLAGAAAVAVVAVVGATAALRLRSRTPVPA